MRHGNIVLRLEAFAPCEIMVAQRILTLTAFRGGATDVNDMVKLSSREKSVLLQIPLVGGGDNGTPGKLMEVSTILTIAARQMLFCEGEVAEHLFCVLSGYVRLYRTSKDGREADIRICGPGDTFNECLIFGSNHYQSSAQVAENCTLARIDLSRIRSLIEEDPTVAKAVVRCLSKSLLTTMDCVANDRLQTAPQRVANYLIMQGPGDSTSYSLRLPFQKSVLAGKLGLAPEALSRAFSSLRDAGVIVRGRTIQVNDIGTLKQF